MHNFVPVELHSDLAAHMYGKALCHPLVEFENVEPCFHARLNRFYEHRLKQQRGEYTPNMWDAFNPEMHRYNRENKLIDSLLLVEKPWSDLSIYRLIGEMWTAPEMLSISSGTLEILLGSDPTPIHTRLMMTDEECQEFDAFPDELIIHRGHHRNLVVYLSSIFG